MRPSNPLSIILDNNRLTGPNFIDWLRNLKVVLASEKILYVIEQGLLLSSLKMLHKRSMKFLPNGRMTT